MARDKTSDPHRPFDDHVGKGRVADKAKGRVYSPRLIDAMKEKSDRARQRDEK